MNAPFFLKFIIVFSFSVGFLGNSFLYASYDPQDGKISQSFGVFGGTQFQENFFNNNENSTKLGRSQSFGVFFRWLGGLGSKSSLYIDVQVGEFEFERVSSVYRDRINLQGPSLNMGYIRNVHGPLWLNLGIGGLYPWHVHQDLQSQAQKYAKSDFYSIYSINMGGHWEFSDSPYSVGLIIKKYISGWMDDQMGISLFLGIHF